MTCVFVYGTLKSGEPNHFHLLDSNKGAAELLGAAVTTQIFPLVIASQYNIPFLLHNPGHGKNIHGEVYKVDGGMLSHLDVLERLYTHLRVNVKLVESGEVMECRVYILEGYKKK